MFLTLIYLLVIALFRNAFTINFFGDDYFFLKVGRAHSIAEFLNFFSPIKDYFYRPIPTELFYFLIHNVKENLLISHLFVFIVYFVGLYFLYKSLTHLTEDDLLPKIVVFLYAISFIHFFQLYMLGTFIEIALFSFLSASFYLYIRGRHIPALIFFVMACMSKETAVLFPAFLLVYNFIYGGKLFVKKVLPYFTIGIVFAVIYKFGVNGVINTVESYRLQANPRLGMNNLMWYTLWSIGLPNFLPDYMTSIFKPPIAEFAKVWKNNEVRIYFGLFFTYFTLLAASLVVYLLAEGKKVLNIFRKAAFVFLGYLLFVSPTLFILHKWMVRLTVPLVFVYLSIGYILTVLVKKGGFGRTLALVTLSAYFAFNVHAIKVHESSSTFFFESKISDRLQNIIEKNREEISKSKYIYFKDVVKGNFNPWGQSQHLKTTLSDQNFLDLYYPKRNLEAIYGFEERKIPKDSYIINSLNLLKP